MNKNMLIGYLTPFPELTSGFCLPVFEDSINIYIQLFPEKSSSPIKDYLDQDMIKKILPLEERVNVPISTYYYGFLDIHGNFTCGSRTKMVSFLRSCANEYEDQPFIQLEVARFIGDKSLANYALVECNSLIASLDVNSSRAWFNTEFSANINDPEENHKKSEARSRKRDISRRAVSSADPDIQATPLKDYPEVEMQRFRLDIGRRNKIKPVNIVAAIANGAELESKYIGEIEIRDEYSTVDLPADIPKEVMSILKKVRVVGRPLEISIFRAGGTNSSAAKDKSERKSYDSKRGYRARSGREKPDYAKK